MEWIAILVAVLFVLIGIACLWLVVLGLPGSWILIGTAILIEALNGFWLPEPAQTFSWKVLLFCVLAGVVGEILEFFAGLLGAKRSGSSKRGMVGALIGGIVGGIMGTGIPIPIIGTLIGAALGTFGGAILGEISDKNEKRTVRESVKPALGATVGSILGTLAKIPIAFTIWVALCIDVFV